MLKFVFGLLLLICSGYATAMITINGEVARLYPDNNNVYFRLKNSQCVTAKYYYFTLDNDIKKSWFAMLLAAANTGKKVHVAVPNCPADTHVVINYIYQDF